MSKNLYDILGVPKDATEDEIKKAYKEQSKKSHPDKGGSDEKMAEVNRAYMVLRNKEKRERYDTTGEETEDKFESKFASLLNEIFLQIIEGSENVDNWDLIECFQTNVDNLISQHKLKLEESMARIKKLGRVIKRVKSRSDKRIYAILQSHVEFETQRTNLINSDIKFLKEAQEILGDYAYDFDRMASNYINVRPGGAIYTSL